MLFLTKMTEAVSVMVTAVRGQTSYSICESQVILEHSEYF